MRDFFEMLILLQTVNSDVPESAEWPVDVAMASRRNREDVAEKLI